MEVSFQARDELRGQASKQRTGPSTMECCKRESYINVDDVGCMCCTLDLSFSYGLFSLSSAQA